MASRKEINEVKTIIAVGAATTIPASKPPKPSLSSPVDPKPSSNKRKKDVRNDASSDYDQTPSKKAKPAPADTGKFTTASGGTTVKKDTKDKSKVANATTVVQETFDAQTATVEKLHNQCLALIESNANNPSEQLMHLKSMISALIRIQSSVTTPIRHRWMYTLDACGRAIEDAANRIWKYFSVADKI